MEHGASSLVVDNLIAGIERGGADTNWSPATLLPAESELEKMSSSSQSYRPSR